MIHRVMTQDGSRWLGTRVGRWFWFNGDPSFWFTQGCVVDYRGMRRVARSVFYPSGPVPWQWKPFHWWYRLGKVPTQGVWS